MTFDNKPTKSTPRFKWRERIDVSKAKSCQSLSKDRVPVETEVQKILEKAELKSDFVLKNAHPGGRVLYRRFMRSVGP